MLDTASAEAPPSKVNATTRRDVSKASISSPAHSATRPAQGTAGALLVWVAGADVAGACVEVEAGGDEAGRVALGAAVVAALLVAGVGGVLDGVGAHEEVGVGDGHDGDGAAEDGGHVGVGLAGDSGALDVRVGAGL